MGIIYTLYMYIYMYIVELCAEGEREFRVYSLTSNFVQFLDSLHNIAVDQTFVCIPAIVYTSMYTLHDAVHLYVHCICVLTA